MHYQPLDKVLHFQHKLYIGDCQGARSYEHYGIRAVITVCSEAPVEFDAEHLLIPIKDRSESDILRYFNETNAFIEQHMEHGNVLVHCMAGKSRSATIVLAYLMYQQKWTVRQALAYLKSIRPKVNPNQGFIKQLQEYERFLFATQRDYISPRAYISPREYIQPRSSANMYLPDQNVQFYY